MWTRQIHVGLTCRSDLFPEWLEKYVLAYFEICRVGTGTRIDNAIAAGPRRNRRLLPVITAVYILIRCVKKSQEGTGGFGPLSPQDDCIMQGLQCSWDGLY